MDRNWALMKRRSALWIRARIIQAIRRFFVDQGYLEVETPHRIPAPAPETYIDAVPSGSWFLHPSPELCMKRLLASGYERIFQICRVWRDGERGSQHTPEFTLLEWYRSGTDYRDLMEECETMIQTVASSVGLGEVVSSRGHTLTLSAPWERISVSDAFHRYARMPMEKALKADLFDELMAREIAPRLGTEKPTFLYDYPSERGALARLKKDNPALAERFELYIGGVEVANAFSELVDAKEQRRRFIKEQSLRREMLKPTYPMPEKFLEELGGMSPSAGIALGVDRLVMVLIDAPRIDDVVAFTPEEL